MNENDKVILLETTDVEVLTLENGSTIELTPEVRRAIADSIFNGSWDHAVAERAAILNPQPVEMEELSISASADNTLNLGDYSSAKRGIFLSAKVKVPSSQTPAERLETWRVETKKLQTLVELQMAAIVTEAMSRDGLNNIQWHRTFVGIFQLFLTRTYKVFGLEVPAAPAATQTNQEKKA